MNLKQYFGYLLASQLLFSGCATHPMQVASPDGNIRLALAIDSNQCMNYQVWVGDSVFIKPSALGLVEKTGVNLARGFRVIDSKITAVDEVWAQPWGENKVNRNHYRQLAVQLEDSVHTQMQLQFRLFNDGVGFRYEVNVPQADSLLITDELTAFNVARDGVAWSIPANSETYELLYRTRPLSQTDNANTPITFRSANCYASIHEAALTDYPEMTLNNVGGTCFKASLAPWPDGVKVRVSGGRFKTPWRTIQLAPQAVGLINSSLILNLNDPCVLNSTDWIRPMKYIGIWWGMHLGVESWVINDRHGATTQNAKRYIDFAAANNIEAVMFEGWNAGWENWGGTQHFDYTKPYADFNIDEVCSYARQKGVAIIGHHETGGNILNYERQLDKAYAWYAGQGIHAVKTGYAGGLPAGHNHHGQFCVHHYRKVVQTAARYHTTLNVHEPIKDTGIRRTYPNMMTREGARGMEWNAWSDGNPPEHHVMLPFTRLLAGPMDYTPGIFDILYEKAKKNSNRKQWNMKDSKDCRINTTLAKQIANWVIIYSPLQMAADQIENYEGHPAFRFFRDFDADCDWSKALAGEPGDFVVIVRRAKEKFFLGAATDEDARKVTVNLDFLDKRKTYKAIIYADASDADWETNPLAYIIMERKVTSNDKLTINMARGGGQAITFLPL